MNSNNIDSNEQAVDGFETEGLTSFQECNMKEASTLDQMHLVRR